jgi:hypothetical protein
MIYLGVRQAVRVLEIRTSISFLLWGLGPWRRDHELGCVGREKENRKGGILVAKSVAKSGGEAPQPG